MKIPARKGVVAVALAGSMLVGGAIGGALFAAGSGSAATTPAANDPTPIDTSNKDAAHEAGESAQRAADEAAGKVGGGDHASNTDAAHEAGESPARAAEEASRDAAIANGSAPSSGGVR